MLFHFSFKVLPATGVPGSCYALGKSGEVAEIEDEPEEEEVDDGGMYSLRMNYIILYCCF